MILSQGLPRSNYTDGKLIGDTYSMKDCKIQRMWYLFESRKICTGRSFQHMATITVATCLLPPCSAVLILSWSSFAHHGHGFFILHPSHHPHPFSPYLNVCLNLPILLPSNMLVSSPSFCISIIRCSLLSSMRSIFSLSAGGISLSLWKGFLIASMILLADERCSGALTWG